VRAYFFLILALKVQTPGQAVIAPVLSSSSNVLHTAASAAPIAAPRTASSSRVSTTSRPVVSKTVGKSKKSASSGYSSALISAAFQEQFMRDLRLDFRSNNTSSSTADRLGLHMHDILVHAQQVSDHVGPQSQLRTALNATEWAHARAKSLQRGDSEAPCAICHANFETSAQVLLSCSHTVALKILLHFVHGWNVNITVILFAVSCRVHHIVRTIHGHSVLSVVSAQSV
jgi:hypothetical protein